MTETTVLTIFVAVTAVAVVLQMLILAGMYFSTRKLNARVTELSYKVENEILPLAAKVRTLVEEGGPKIQSLLTDVAETSALVRAKAVEVDATLSEVLTVVRTQANNAGVLAERTISRLDNAAASVQHAVTSPVRHFQALIEGVTAGLGQFLGARKTQRPRPVPKDEMFI
ncbi:MAG: hypothetical protein P4M01_06475 [Acidobacteriota bacterium]|nr:hypothetical protein [Acidobacteriota bacterium]